MFTRETLKAAGAVSVSAVEVTGKVRHGYWLEDICFDNECLTEWGINIYINSTFEKVVKDGGFLYHETLVASGYFNS